MGYRRGFKSDANSTAREIREELGLKSTDALDPWRLAEHLAVPVIPLSALSNDVPDAARYLLDIEPEVFSAVTVFYGSRRIIVHNDAHSRGRQASDLSHELAHALLMHGSSPAIDHRGCRLWDQNIEDEAQWLAGALLVTEEAALSVARNDTPLQAAAAQLGVSVAMLRYRINVTGARKRVERARRFYVVKDS
jgi:Zn-dependent peptidase ImmA (M78 family)